MNAINPALHRFGEVTVRLAVELGRTDMPLKDVLALEVEEGETQFAQCKIKMGILVGRPDIAPASEADFRKKSFAFKSPSPLISFCFIQIFLITFDCVF